MKYVVLILVGIALLYFIIKVALHQARKAYLSRLLEKMDTLYNNLIKNTRDELASVSENYSKWKSGDEVQRVVYDGEEELLARITDAKSALAHEESVREKYLRLRARFSADPKKVGEAIVAYHNYLSIKMKQHLDAETYVRALNVGAMTFDEFAASGRETRILVEECERRLDVLLS